MHPNKSFRWTDETEMRAFAAARGFAHVFAATADGPMVAHVPLTLAEGGHFRFHLSRGNRLGRHLDGAAVLASVAGDDFYVSPDWYAAPVDQVPTWNYITVEIEGIAHALGEADLLDQIDALSAAHEARLAPKPVWTRDKVSEPKLHGMVSAIEAFELEVSAIRGNRKLSQNKHAADRAGVIAALRALGHNAHADLLA